MKKINEFQFSLSLSGSLRHFKAQTRYNEDRQSIQTFSKSILDTSSNWSTSSLHHKRHTFDVCLHKPLQVLQCRPCCHTDPSPSHIGISSHLQHGWRAHRHIPEGRPELGPRPSRPRVSPEQPIKTGEWFSLASLLSASEWLRLCFCTKWLLIEDLI